MAAPIVISILANARQANAGLNETSGLLGKVGGAARRMAIPVAAGIAALVVGGKQAIDSASDLSEEVSKSAVIFGDQAKEIRNFAKSAQDSLGQSQTAALDAASTFGQIGQKAGLGAQESAAFSKQFVTLASDIASFNNTSPEEAIQAIGSAMRGEAEPIRKYGVLLDDATLRNRALKEGLIDNVKTALTPQQKALAASKEILAQTTKAQGDFARTSDGAANKSRILAAQGENLKAKIGTGLLPVYVKLLGVLSTVLDFLDRHQETFQRVAGVVTGFFTRLSNGSATSGARFDEFRQTVSSALANVQAIVASAVSIVTSLWARFGSDLTRYATTSLTNVLTFIRGAFTLLAGIFKTVAALLKGDWSGAWDGIKQIVRGALTVVGAIVRQALNLVRTLFSVGGKAIGSLVSAAFNGLASLASAGVNKLLDLVRGIPGKITDLFSGAKTLLSDIGRFLIDGLVSGLTGAAQKVYDKVAEIGGKVKAGFKNVLEVFSPSRYTRELGKFVAKGLELGLMEGVSGITSAVTKTGVKTKAALKKQTAEILSQIKTAGRERLNALKAQRAEYAAAVAGAARDYASLGNLTLGDNENLSIGGITQFLADRLGAINNFNDKLASIRGRVSSAVYDQIVQLGVEQGTGYAEALSTASPAALAQVNALQNQITSASNVLGANTSNAMYAAGIQSAQGYYDGLQSMLKKIEKQGVKIAKALIKELRKALDINSPSKVLRSIGRYSIDGLDQGLDASRVQDKGRDLAKSLVKGYASPQLDAQFSAGFRASDASAAGTGGYGSVTIGRIDVRFDPSMSIEEMGVEYNKAIEAARKIGLVPR